MGASQRRKGASAERELAKLLSSYLKLPDICRNLNQTRDGGHDLSGLPFALEVKRQEKEQLPAWWQQTVQQADACNKPPALAYRRSRQPWRFVVPVHLLGYEQRDYTLTYTATVGVVFFCELIGSYNEPCITPTE